MKKFLITAKNSLFRKVTYISYSLPKIIDEEWWPWILCASKCDLAEDRVVSSEQGIQLAGKLKASGYIEGRNLGNVT